MMSFHQYTVQIWNMSVVGLLLKESLFGFWNWSPKPPCYCCWVRQHGGTPKFRNHLSWIVDPGNQQQKQTSRVH